MKTNGCGFLSFSLWLGFMYNFHFRMRPQLKLQKLPSGYAWKLSTQSTRPPSLLSLSRSSHKKVTKRANSLYFLDIYITFYLFYFYIISALVLTRLSWKLNWAFWSPVVCLSVCPAEIFSHFQFLFQNHWAKFNQT